MHSPIALAHTLPTIQKEAHARFQYSVSDTLKHLEALYARGLISYPRTDNGYLPESLFKPSRKLVKALRGVVSGIVRDEVESTNDFKVDHTVRGAVWNDAQVATHYGIIPLAASAVSLYGLSVEQLNLYFLVCQKFLRLFERKVAPAVRKPEVSLIAENEETVDVQVDGESIGTLTYDVLGWAGLAAAKNVVADLAVTLGARVTRAAAD